MLVRMTTNADEPTIIHPRVPLGRSGLD